MKHLLIFLILSIMCLAETLSFGYSLNTTHITSLDENSDDYKFYEQNNVLTLEIENNKELIGLVAFKNSFGNDTIGIYLGKRIDKNNKGFYTVYRTGFLKGYNKIDYLKSLDDPENHWYGFNNKTVFYKNYSLLAEFGIGYKLNKTLSLETNLIANAVVSSVKITF